MSQIVLQGDTSGQTIIQAPSNVSGAQTLNLPQLASSSDTLVGKSTSDILTNKTLDTAATGNVLKINGTQVSAVTGSGSVVLGTSPTFATSILLNNPGSGTTTVQASGGPFSVTLPANSGTILTTPVAAGSASGAPIVLSSGTLASTASAGGLEYNGYAAYFTPAGTQRGVMPAFQYYVLPKVYQGTQLTTPQSIFGLTNGVTLSGNTIYEYEMSFNIYKTNGTNSHYLTISFGGTNAYNYNAFTYIDNINGTVGYGYNVTGNSIYNINVASASYSISAFYKGIISVYTGGTFNPQYTLSTSPGGSWVTQLGSYLKISPIASGASNVNIGTWS
jgi:hypothetical protein